MCPNSKLLGELRKYCQKENRVYPLIAAQIITKVMMEAFQSGTSNLLKQLSVLSFANPKTIPFEWEADYQVVSNALLHHPDNSNCRFLFIIYYLFLFFL